MRSLIRVGLLVVFLASLPAAFAAGAEKLPLRLLYLARDNGETRADAFGEFLSATFERLETAQRSDFRPEMLSEIDVVILDWSQQGRYSAKYPSPLGRLEDFKTPLLLLGSAGHVIAGPWYVIGGAG